MRDVEFYYNVQLAILARSPTSWTLSLSFLIIASLFYSFMLFQHIFTFVEEASLNNVIFSESILKLCILIIIKMVNIIFAFIIMRRKMSLFKVCMYRLIIALPLNDIDLWDSQSCSRIFGNKCRGWIILRFMSLKR